MWLGGVNDVTHQKLVLRFEKSQWVEFLPRKKNVDFSLARRGLAAGVARGLGQMEKSV